MRINTNISALRATKNVSRNKIRVGDTQRKLSSGKRVTRAGDDAAALSISSKLTAHIRSQRQAIRNANDSISYFQIAEGALHEMSSMITRMRELSIQSASDTIGDSERKMLDKEMQQLKTEINRLNSSTEAMGKKLFSSEGTFDVMVDIHNKESSFFKIDLSKLSQNTHALGIYDAHVASKLQAGHSLAKLDYAQKQLSESLAYLGSFQNRTEATINNLTQKDVDLTASNSRMIDADYAQVTAENVKSKLLLETSTGVLKRANQDAAIALKLLG